MTPPSEVNRAAVDQLSNNDTRGGSRLMSRVLPPAIRLWLHAQVEQVEQLQFEIQGRDRQILSGHIPGVAIAAANVIYQGLHLSRLDLAAAGIRINLGQVLRGRPLTLKQPFPVSGTIVLTEAALNRSLESALLKQGLQDFLTRLAEGATPPPAMQAFVDYLHTHSGDQMEAGIALQDAALWLTLTAPDGALEPRSLQIQTGLRIDQRYLMLVDPVLVQADGKTQPLAGLSEFRLDLGGEVAIERLAIAEQTLTCHGVITVTP